MAETVYCVFSYINVSTNWRRTLDCVCVCVCVCVPVIAVEVIQPAAFLHQLNGARVVPPGGVAVRAFVLLALAALHSALIGLLDLVVDVVVQTLGGVGLPVAQACGADRETVSA